MIALTAAALFTPLEKIEQPLVLLEDGSILEVTSQAHREIPANARVADFPDGILVPGFIDMHIHGGAGHDVMEAGDGALASVEQLLARHGVTSYFPTTVTAPTDTILSSLQRLADAIEAAEDSRLAGELRARPLGIHLEGPFINHRRRGVHPSEDLLPPAPEAFERFWEISRGHIRVMTIAPELPGAREVIKDAAQRGVCVSLGHSDANLASARVGVDAGARHFTHTFNAMRPLDHRDPGVIGAALTDPRVTADIIADGIHLDPIMVELFLKAKGAEKAVLITDATSATGMPDGAYPLGSLEVQVKAGKCVAGGKLAGSVLTMDRAIRNVMKFADWGLQQAVRLATLNPARVTGLNTRGILKAGAEADMVVLSPNGDVKNTIIGGAGL
jgi:N-acetylglucosamine-6-phosphate deacetylase